MKGSIGACNFLLNRAVTLPTPQPTKSLLITAEPCSAKILPRIKRIRCLCSFPQGSAGGQGGLFPSRSWARPPAQGMLILQIACQVPTTSVQHAGASQGAGKGSQRNCTKFLLETVIRSWLSRQSQSRSGRSQDTNMLYRY